MPRSGTRFQLDKYMCMASPLDIFGCHPLARLISKNCEQPDLAPRLVFQPEEETIADTGSLRGNIEVGTCLSSETFRLYVTVFT
jgi:hypothetical protein